MRVTRRIVIKGAAGIAALSACGLAAFKASAHRQHECFTTMTWVARRSSLEVEHLFHFHDAAVLLTEYLGVGRPDLSDTTQLAQLALYCEERFMVRIPGTGEGQEGEGPEATIPLVIPAIGAEELGSDVACYQDLEMDALPAWFDIDNQILRDVYRSQRNFVNLDAGTGVRTVEFSGRDQIKRLAV